MSLIEIKIHIPDENKAEILSALLLNSGYEGCYQEEDDFFAYIQDKDFEERKLMRLLAHVDKKLHYTVKNLEDTNWNAEWEKNYPSVRINDVFIYADFHLEDKAAHYAIRINPQMSFGTAHHETTALMLECMQKMDLQGKIIMDMGCGTAVLAILAKMMKASHVDAVDNDDWAYKNALSNIKTNAVEVSVYKGDASFLQENNKSNLYDVFIANINRNILLNDISEYAVAIKNKGDLLLSGFYENDLKDIQEKAAEHKLVFQTSFSKNNWCLAHFKKEL